MQHNDSVVSNGLNPTFLFTWKGVRMKDEERYHAHEYIELAFIMSGRGKYKIDDRIYDISEGDLLILNPGVYHQALVADPKFPATEFFIGACDFCFEGMQPNHLEVDTLPVYKTGSELKQQLMRLCTSMGAENDACRVGRYYMMQSYLIQFLLLVLRNERQPKSASGGSYSFESINKNEIVTKIIDYFGEHYSEKISLDIISENMYVSPFYISKIFKSVTGDTPIRHLINVRLDRARELLCGENGMSIAEIAASVGYDDAYHFSKLFKKRFGVSPSKIRTGYGENESLPLKEGS
ncbi:MAG: AraC family transcriptional regulator [Lachnospiraceae bacterium]|nr:AraC family transcriptional regulator [Lachnospiraceae bacterium]